MNYVHDESILKETILIITGVGALLGIDPLYLFQTYNDK